jgi:ATP-binding cassette subfamily B protein
MNLKTLRSLSLGAIALSRQFGIRITAEQLEQKISRGQIGSERELKKSLSEQSVRVQRLKPKFKTFLSRSYYFPCLAMMRDGTTKIIISCNKNREGLSEIQSIDPLDPTNKVLIEEDKDFRKNWAGSIYLISEETGITSQDRMFDWTWFVPELYRFKGLLALTLIAAIITHILSLAPIVFIQISLDKVLNYGAVSTLYILLIGVCAALIIGGILGYAKDYVINFISTSIEARLSGDIFDKVMALPASTFQTKSNSEFENVLQSSVKIKSFISQQVLTTIFNATSILVFLPVLFGYSPVLALIVVLFATTIGTISLFGKWRQKEEQNISAPIEAHKRRMIQSSVAGIETVKAFSLEASQRRDWRKVSSKSIRQSVKGKISSIVITNINNTLTQLMTIALITSGILLVLNDALSAGAVISCNMLGGKLISPFTAIFTFFYDLSGFRSTVENVGESWNGPNERVGRGNEIVIKGEVVCKDVVIKFERINALNGLTLKIPARTRVAIVGPSGSGKTTFLRLCQGFLKPNTGSMEIDGQNYRYLSLENYRSQNTLIDGNPVFFGATIEENLRKIQPNISEREFEEILEISGLQEVLEELPNGISTEINQFGMPLSQGDRVTLALARGLIARPRILLLDEALANFDKATQVAFFRNFDRIAHEKTVIMATHDIRSTRNFEQIIVLEKGKVVGCGNHEVLLKNCRLYSELWDMDRKL